jgi:hypothetical protein
MVNAKGRAFGEGFADSDDQSFIRPISSITTSIITYKQALSSPSRPEFAFQDQFLTQSVCATHF